MIRYKGSCGFLSRMLSITLCPNVIYISEIVPWAFEKTMYSAVLGWNVLQMLVKCLIRKVILFISLSFVENACKLRRAWYWRYQLLF